MSEEIKEILDRIETASEIFDCLLKPKECTELLDYITNLQQKVEQLEKENKKLKQWDVNKDTRNSRQRIANRDAYKKIEQLEKENKGLKQQELTMPYDSRLSYLKQRCEYLERSNNRREDEIIELRDENANLVSKNNQLENIRKEAIDYVKQNCQIIRYKDEYGNLIDKIGEVNGYALLNILNKRSDK